MSNLLTTSFKWEEFDCHDGSKVPREYWGNVRLLATNLEALRRKIGRPIVIVSGYRSPGHNKKVGGAKGSQHLTASAADIKVPGIDPVQVKKEIEALIEGRIMTEGGVGLYPTWVHYDIRGTRARW